jgi:5-hydroxyisourate hydrolase-like protein (transthyretin family)
LTRPARRRIAAIGAGFIAVTGFTAVPAAAETASITGTVVAADTGEPIPNANVYVYDAETFDFVGAADTDDTGSFSVDGLAEGGEYKVEVGEWNTFISEWLFDARWFDEADIITAPATVNVELERGAHVSGLVRDPDGQPAAEVEFRIVDADTEEWLVSAFTDDEGRFHELVPAGPIKVMFRSDLGVQWAVGQTSFETATIFDAVAGETLFIQERLVDLTGEITGAVTSATTGEPLADICVVTVPPDDPWGGEDEEVCTGADGQYTIDVLAGDYKIRFSDSSGEYLQRYYGGITFADAAVVSVGAGDTISGIDATLNPAAAAEGRVIDRVTRQPIPDVCVYAFDIDGQNWIDGQVNQCSDEGGYWRISGLPAGAVKLMTYGTEQYGTQWFNGASTPEDARILRVRAGRTTKVPPFPLEQGAIVTGTVTNEAGEPIEGACVQVSYVPNSRIGGCDFGAETGENGVYTIYNVPPGEQVFGAGKLWPYEYASVWNGGASHQSAAEPITIESGETTTVDFVLPPTATISGTVDIPEGYVMLNAYTVDGDMIGTGADLENGEPFPPGPDGGFILAGLPTSSVFLEVRVSDPDDGSETVWWYEVSESFETATPISVVSGQDTRISIVKPD